jgi:hypothetical protein
MARSNMLRTYILVKAYSRKGIHLKAILAEFCKAEGCVKGALAVAFGTKWAYKEYGQRVFSSEAQ